MGAEFISQKLKAKNKQEVEKEYKKNLDAMLEQQARKEAEFLLGEVDSIPDDECAINETLNLKKDALQNYADGRFEAAKDLMADYLTGINAEILYQYTGNFLSLDEGVDFKDEEFKTEEEAIKFLEDTHEKWEMPIAVKLKGKDEWLLGGNCPT